jgi:hypothetical protein
MTCLAGRVSELGGEAYAERSGVAIVVIVEWRSRESPFERDASRPGPAIKPF